MRDTFRAAHHVDPAPPPGFQHHSNRAGRRPSGTGRPAWFDTLQAALTPGLQLIATYPPAASLLLALMVMAMILLPTRQAVPVVLPGWRLIGLPVLVHLLAHPLESATPRCSQLLMTYGPVAILVVVLLPRQRGLAGKIQQPASESASKAASVWVTSRPSFQAHKSSNSGWRRIHAAA